MSARDIAVVIIKQEHQSLARVLHILQDMLARVSAGHASPEFGLFSAALYYIDDFQEQCHHPKEDEYLFRFLRASSPKFNSVIDGLQAAHVSSAQAISQLNRHLVQYQGGAPFGLESLRAGVEAYAEQMYEHMRCEEELLEGSRNAIGEQDWVQIAAAFDENDDPLFGNNRRQHFGLLYQRIRVMVPRKLKKDLDPAGRSERPAGTPC